MDGPPYLAFAPWLRERYGRPVSKLSLVSGLGCPNRDGTIADAGCLFCDEHEAGREPSTVAGRSVTEQFRAAAAVRLARRPDTGFLAYLQAGSNTYGAMDRLAALYREVRALSGIVGVSIGTRPDLLPEPVLDLIAETFAGIDVWIEIGVQSADDATLAAIGRNHDFAAVVDAAARVRARGFLLCAHVILGLPGEGEAHVRRTAERLRAIAIDGVKLHPLVVTRGSRLEPMWRGGGVELIDEGRYVAWAVDFLERTDPRVVVQRLVGAGRAEVHFAPEWPKNGERVRRLVVEEFARRGTRQGARAS
jgi:radical SAM protein (TIGR01212 family)